MYPAQTNYHRAGSVAEAVQLLVGNEGAKLLAGGHSLIPAMKLRLAMPTALVDIGHIEALKGITANGGALSIGALTTFAEIASSDLVKAHAPLLAEATGMVGDPAVRNRGTIGGNVSHGDPASDPPTALTALGAMYNVSRAQRRAQHSGVRFRDGAAGERAAGERDSNRRLSSIRPTRRWVRVCQVSSSRLALRRRWRSGHRRGAGRNLLVRERGYRGRRDYANQGVVR